MYSYLDDMRYILHKHVIRFGSYPASVYLEIPHWGGLLDELLSTTHPDPVAPNLHAVKYQGVSLIPSVNDCSVSIENALQEYYQLSAGSTGSLTGTMAKVQIGAYWYAVYLPPSSVSNLGYSTTAIIAPVSATPSSMEPPCRCPNHMVGIGDHEDSCAYIKWKRQQRP